MSLLDANCCYSAHEMTLDLLHLCCSVAQRKRAGVSRGLQSLDHKILAFQAAFSLRALSHDKMPLKSQS